MGGVCFKLAPGSGNGVCTSPSNPASITVAISTANYGTLTNMVNVATYTANILASGSYPSSLGWTQLAAPVGQATFRLFFRAIADNALTTCSLKEYFDDADKAPEFASPTPVFWGAATNAT